MPQSQVDPGAVAWAPRLLDREGDVGSGGLGALAGMRQSLEQAVARAQAAAASTGLRAAYSTAELLADWPLTHTLGWFLTLLAGLAGDWDAGRGT